MAGDLSFEHDHNLGAAEVRRRLADVEAKLRDRFGVGLVWTGNVGQVEGKGVSGQISITDTKVVVNLKLGLLMRPLAGKIREAMQRQIDKLA